MRPRLLSCAFEFLVVEPAPLHLPVDLGDPDQDDQVEDGDQVEEAAGDRRADDVGRLVQAGARRC